jgi:surfeit locus 1 family protein
MIPRIISLRPYVSLATAVAIGVCIFFINAKNNQIQANMDKFALFQERNPLPTLKKLPFPIDYSSEASQALRFRRVELQGRFLTDHEIYLENRVAEVAGNTKKANGFHIMMPFLLDSGQIVCVNRGWVARDPINRQNIPSVKSNDQVQTIKGFISLGRKSIFEMPNEKPLINNGKVLALNFYLHDDKNELPTRQVYPFIITQSGIGDDGLARPSEGFYYTSDYSFDLRAWWITLAVAISFWLISSIVIMRKERYK